MRAKIYALAALGVLFLATSASQAAVNLTARERAIFDEVNQLRQKAGLQPLHLSTELTHAARAQAIAMAQHKSGEQVLDGKGPWDRVKTAGYKGQYVGDNLAYGFPTAGDTMKFWMGVQRAKDLILNPTVTEVGVGDHLSGGTPYWVLFVGRQASGKTPAPVPPTPAPVPPPPVKVTPTPAPVTPTPAPVVNLNAKVLAFAQANLGKKIGDGQCWTLADQALAAAGAKRPGTGGLTTYQFGTAVSATTNPPASLMKAGDIIQFEGVKVVNGNFTNDFSHHTAIIQSVQGNVVTMLNQNVNGQMFVQTTTIDISKVTQGSYQVFQPVTP